MRARVLVLPTLAALAGAGAGVAWLGVGCVPAPSAVAPAKTGAPEALAQSRAAAPATQPVPTVATPAAPTIAAFGSDGAALDSGEGRRAALDSGEGRRAALDPATQPLPPELVDDGVDDAVEAEPEPEPPPPPRRKPPQLASIAKETWVYAEPRWGARRIGYLRAGAVVTRRAKPAGNSSCEEGWYRIEPHGYVCAGNAATLALDHPVVQASERRPDRSGAGLPYTYVMARFPTPPLYAKLPSRDEQRAAEPDLAFVLRQLAQKQREPEFVPPPSPDPTPEALSGGRMLPALAGVHRSAGAVIDRAKSRSGFALLSTFDHEGRRFGLTTELAVLPVDRTRVIRPSSFVGVHLSDEVTLPVAFVKAKHAVRFDEDGAGLRRGAALDFRQAVPLAESTRQVQGVTYWQATDGSWLRADQAVRVDPFSQRPTWATAGRKWIDVSILKQALVAYEGTRPVYVTLVSTGADGLGDPKKTHSTIQGAFLIHTKHVSVTMDGDDVGDEFDLRDVPFVQYFTEGFALHGAYWHDDFGTPRSHGCVNLAPRDAAWLFGWTTPEVPDDWHGALSLKRGTLVYTHP